jgi:methylglyoxal reductase
MTMLQREIGRSGISASAIGLGTWAIGGWLWGGSDDAASIAAIRASIDNGVTLIDTAPGYGLGHAETLVGEAIASRRDEVIIATKCGLNWHHGKGTPFFEELGHSVSRYLGADGIRYEVDESLRRLGTDYIDLYITHWQDAATPISETLEALEGLKAEGKIRAIGASNVSPQDLDAYLAAGRIDAIQEKYSLIDRELEAGLLPTARAQHVSLLSYSPLGQGLLTGLVGPDRVFAGDDLRRDNPRFSLENRRKCMAFAQAIKPLADRHGATVSQVVIAWTMMQPGIDFVLCGARGSEQAIENAQAGHIVLGPEGIAAVDAAAATHLTALDV